ncbi:MAG: ABC transporter permease subunit [Balneola sp.]|nr:MAG: ABC transporter permease subunit [Balneola sp.]
MKRLLILILIFPVNESVLSQELVKIGSKLFTESVILGEVAKQLAESEGIETEFYRQLGGTRVVWNALVEGEIDIYPEYTGTLIQEILQNQDIDNLEEIETELAKYGITTTKPIGFNNTYALGMKKELADELGIKTISDLRNHPSLRFGFTNEFIDRTDGWKGLKTWYSFDEINLTGLDHDLAYRGLEAGNIDVIDLYSTDAEIEYYELISLEDDQKFFPVYEAVFLYRKELENDYPELVDKLKLASGTIEESKMSSMNAAVKIDGQSDSEVAAAYLQTTFNIQSEVFRESMWKDLWKHTLDHLYLVGISLGLAILFAIPLGVMASKFSRLESTLLGLVGILQTIPSLALLVFMIPLLGIGALPAMAALFLYSLLPIVRNTHAGITNIPQPIIESANALGLPAKVILQKIELPLAIPTILAGIKTSAVINVGTATLGALIGAGGYGQPILTGIRLDDTALILQGAIPAALLALLVQWVFDLIEKKLSVEY